MDFEYILISVNDLEVSKIQETNTLIDNIFLADKKQTRKEWTDNITDLLQRIREMEKNDLNEWITWFSNVIRELDAEEQNKFIEQLRKGDEKIMCSSFERLLVKEKIEGKAEGIIEGKAEGIIKGKAESIIELLEDIGIPSEVLKKKILSQTDTEILRLWLKNAARATSIETFEESIKS